MGKHGKSMKTIKGPAVFWRNLSIKKPLLILWMACVNGPPIWGTKVFKYPLGKVF
jgi:hypothetical protein